VARSETKRLIGTKGQRKCKRPGFFALLATWGVPASAVLENMLSHRQPEGMFHSCAFCGDSQPWRPFVKVADGVYMHTTCAYDVEPRVFGGWL